MRHQSMSSYDEISVESHEGKVLVSSENSITVIVRPGHRQSFMQRLPRSLLPCILASLLTSIGTGLVMLYAVDHLRGEVIQRLEARADELERRFAAGFADAQDQSALQVGSLMVRTDDIDRKLNLIPEKIDGASKRIVTSLDLLPAKIDGASKLVATSLTDSLASLRDALASSKPLSARPSLLLIKRRKATN